MKSKKLLCALATVALSTSFAAYLSACGGHDHTFSTDWTPDGANGHYHAATCDDYDGEKNSFEGHTAANSEGKCDKCGYVLTPASTAVTGITISGADTVKVGETTTLTYQLTPSNATGTVVWTSSDTTKATVNANGVVTGVAEGEVTITAAVGTVTQTKTITVTHAHAWEWHSENGMHWQECTGCDEKTEKELHNDVNGDGKCDDCEETLTPAPTTITAVFISGDTYTVVAGQSITLTASFLPEGATATVVWTSADETKATVNENGVVTGVSAGNVIITAAVGTVKQTREIVVRAAQQGDKELTAEEWEAAFDMGTVYGFEQYCVVNGDIIETRAEVAGDSAHYRIAQHGMTFEGYTSKHGDETYLYTSNYEYWNRSLADKGMPDFAAENARLMSSFFPFEKFEKAETPYTYLSKESYDVLVDDSDEDKPVYLTVSDVVVTFRKGKVHSLEYTLDGVEYQITFRSITTVSIPQMTVSDEILTEAEWNAALAVSGDNYRAGLGMQGTVGIEYKHTEDIKFIYANYEVMGEDGEQRTYYVKEGNKYYTYNEKYNQWIKEEIPENVFGALNYDALFQMMDFSKFAFSDFEYDGFEGAYVSTKPIEGFYGPVSVKIKDGKVISVTCNGQGIDIVYGDVELVAPVISAGEQLTDEEWVEAFALDFEKGEGNIEVIGYDNLVFRKDGGVIYQNFGKEVYAVQDGEEYYLLEPKDGVWTKSVLTRAEYENYLPAEMISVFAEKSDYNWDEDSGTYKSSALVEYVGGDVEIKFTDKKISYIMISGVENIFISYDTAPIILPQEGDKYEGGNSEGPGPDVEIKKIPSEYEWDAFINENTLACDNFIIEYSVGDNDREGVSYSFDIENGYIYVIERYENLDYKTYTIYTVNGGKVVSYTKTGEPESTYSFDETDYESLTAVKEDIINRLFMLQVFGKDIRDMREHFADNGNNWSFEDNGVQIHLELNYVGEDSDEKRLSFMSVYFAEENLNNIRLSFQLFGETKIDFPGWYPNYEGMQISESAWEKALPSQQNAWRASYSYDYYFEFDGERLRVYNEGENVFYYKNGNQYFKREKVEENWVDSPVDESVVTAIIQEATLHGLLNYGDFTYDPEAHEYTAASVAGLGSDVILKFENKKLVSVTYTGDNGPCQISYEHWFGYGDLTLPVNRMTAEEWNAAFDATSSAVKFRNFVGTNYDNEYYEAKYDLDNGFIYRESNGTGLLYLLEGEKVYLYTYYGEGYSKVETEFTSLQEIHDNLLADMFTPPVLNGITLKELYAQFTHDDMNDIYHYDNYEEGMDDNDIVNVEIQFADGKISSVGVYVGYNRNDYEFFDYDTEDNFLPYWYLDILEGENK